MSRPAMAGRTRFESSSLQMPLCTSSFLQDLSIAIGRQMKRLKRGKRSLIIERSIDHTDGSARERLDIESRNLLGVLVKSTIWEDGIAWVFIRRDSPKRDRRVIFEGYLDVREMTISETGEALFDLFENHAVRKDLLLKEE